MKIDRYECDGCHTILDKSFFEFYARDKNGKETSAKSHFCSLICMIDTLEPLAAPVRK